MNTSKLDQIETIAKDLLKYHSPLFVFQWDKGKRRYGYCSYTKQVISVSAVLADLNPIEETINTILHEIAHSLTKGYNHGPVWKAKCKEIGGDGKTYYNSNLVMQPKKTWVLVKDDGFVTKIKRFRRFTLRQDSGYHWAKAV